MQLLAPFLIPIFLSTSCTAVEGKVKATSCVVTVQSSRPVGLTVCVPTVATQPVQPGTFGGAGVGWTTFSMAAATLSIIASLPARIQRGVGNYAIEQPDTLHKQGGVFALVASVCRFSSEALQPNSYLGTQL